MLQMYANVTLAWNQRRGLHGWRAIKRWEMMLQKKMLQSQNSVGRSSQPPKQSNPTNRGFIMPFRCMNEEGPKKMPSAKRFFLGGGAPGIIQCLEKGILSASSTQWHDGGSSSRLKFRFWGPKIYPKSRDIREISGGFLKPPMIICSHSQIALVIQQQAQKLMALLFSV